MKKLILIIVVIINSLGLFAQIDTMNNKMNSVPQERFGTRTNGDSLQNNNANQTLNRGAIQEGNPSGRPNQDTMGTYRNSTGQDRLGEGQYTDKMRRDSLNQNSNSINRNNNNSNSTNRNNNNSDPNSPSSGTSGYNNSGNSNNPNNTSSSPSSGYNTNSNTNRMNRDTVPKDMSEDKMNRNINKGTDKNMNKGTDKNRNNTTGSGNTSGSNMTGNNTSGSNMTDGNTNRNSNMTSGDMPYSRGVHMMNGKVMIVKNNKMITVQNHTYLPGGIKIMSDGTVTKKDGTTMMLKEGEFINRKGEVVPMVKQ